VGGVILMRRSYRWTCDNPDYGTRIPSIECHFSFDYPDLQLNNICFAGTIFADCVILNQIMNNSTGIC
jgi:hypothetical protein